MRRRPRRDIINFLHEARGAVGRIAAWTTDRSLTDYLTDDFLRSAVERQFEILGESLRSAEIQDDELRNRIPQMGDVIGMRNAIAHEYYAVDDEIVWSAIQHSLPILLKALDTYLAEVDS